MHTITREIQAKIDATAEMLPVILSNTHEKHKKTGAQIIEEDNIHEIGGKPIDPEKFYVMKYPVQLYHNHRRRLRKAFMASGYAGVQQYVMHVHSITQENK